MSEPIQGAAPASVAEARPAAAEATSQVAPASEGSTAATTLGTKLAERMAGDPPPETAQAALADLAAGSVGAIAAEDGATAAARADAAELPTVAQQVDGVVPQGSTPDIDQAAINELGMNNTNPDGHAPPPDFAQSAPGGVDASAAQPTISEPQPQREAPTSQATAEPSPVDNGLPQTDVSAGTEPSTYPDSGEPAATNTEATPDGEQNQTQEKLTLEQAAKVKELEATLQLGKNLDKFNVSEDQKRGILEQIAVSGDPQAMIEAFNGLLEKLPSPGENPMTAAQESQQQENQLAEQVGKLDQQAKEGKLDEKGKQKLGLLKRLLVALKFVTMALVVLTTGVVAGPAAIALGGKK